MSNACDPTTSTCINTFGSYECQCIEGGSINDNKKGTCSKNISDPKTSWNFGLSVPRPKYKLTNRALNSIEIKIIVKKIVFNKLLTKTK